MLGLSGAVQAQHQQEQQRSRSPRRSGSISMEPGLDTIHEEVPQVLLQAWSGTVVTGQQVHWHCGYWTTGALDMTHYLCSRPRGLQQDSSTVCLICRSSIMGQCHCNSLPLCMCSACRCKACITLCRRCRRNAVSSSAHHPGSQAPAFRAIISKTASCLAVRCLVSKR